MSDTFDELDIELYAESWEYLNRDNIPIAKKVQKLVSEGVLPDAIGQRVRGTLGAHREPFVKRCELAAKYLYSQKVKA